MADAAAHDYIVTETGNKVSRHAHIYGSQNIAVAGKVGEATMTTLVDETLARRADVVRRPCVSCQGADRGTCRGELAGHRETAEKWR
jgi:hypothetical protein